MGRLCERPGCSEGAAVVYGMRPEDAVFWLDALGDDRDPAAGTLCRRHADSMTVPRGWTLDDLRDPDLHLFRPPDVRSTTAVGRRRRRPVGTSEAVEVEQLELSGLAATVATPVPGESTSTHHEPDADTASEPAVVSQPPADPAAPWSPVFDDEDDLGGLLSARSPLLSRAFRGTDRPR